MERVASALAYLCSSASAAIGGGAPLAARRLAAADRKALCIDRLGGAGRRRLGALAGPRLQEVGREIATDAGLLLAFLPLKYVAASRARISPSKYT
jgi:hypothetical protein